MNLRLKEKVCILTRRLVYTATANYPTDEVLSCVSHNMANRNNAYQHYSLDPFNLDQLFKNTRPNGFCTPTTESSEYTSCKPLFRNDLQCPAQALIATVRQHSFQVTGIDRWTIHRTSGHANAFVRLRDIKRKRNVSHLQVIFQYSPTKLVVLLSGLGH